MKFRMSFTFLIFVVVLAIVPAAASDPFCVKFDGIDGQGIEWCDPGSTYGYEYHHLVSRELQGGLPGPIMHNQVIITREWDNITPQLWRQLDLGTAIQEVIFQFPPSQGGPPQHEIRLTNVYILAIEPLIPHSRETNPYGKQDRIRMSYQSISIQYDRDDPVILQASGGGH